MRRLVKDFNLFPLRNSGLNIRLVLDNYSVCVFMHFTHLVRRVNIFILSIYYIFILKHLCINYLSLNQ